MSADGITVAAGAPENDDNEHKSGHAIVCAYSSATHKWNRLGNDLVGA